MDVFDASIRQARAIIALDEAQRRLEAAEDAHTGARRLIRDYGPTPEREANYAAAKDELAAAEEARATANRSLATAERDFQNAVDSGVTG